MFGVLFYGIPLAVFVWFGISLYRYLTAKRENSQAPGSYEEREIKQRKLVAILSGVIAAVLLAVVMGFIVLLCLSIAYM